MSKYKKVFICFVSIGICLWCSISIGNSAFADTKSSVIQKSILQGLYRCYTTGAIDSKTQLSKFNEFEQLIIGGKKETYVALPTSLTSIKDNDVSCKQLFLGYHGWGGDFDGLFKMFGKSEYAGNITDNKKKITLLEGMGYAKSSNSSKNKTCAYYVYDVKPDNVTAYTNMVCESDGKISVEETNFDCNNDTYLCQAPVYFHTDNQNELKIYDDNFITEKTIKRSSYKDWNAFREKLNSIISADFNKPNSTYAGAYVFSSSKSSETQNSDGDSNYEIKDFKTAAGNAIKFLYPTYQKHSDISFTDEEKLWYYSYTIGNWFFKGKNLSDYYTCGIAENPSLYGNYIIININPSTNAKNTAGDCGINKDATVTDEGIHGVFQKERGRDTGYFDADGANYTSLETVVSVINTLAGNMSDEQMAGITTNGEDDNGKEVKTCSNAGGAGSLGWIVCPVMEWMAKAAVDVYNDALEPALKIEPELFTKGGDSGARQGWKIFQNMANVIFIAMFLVVIFSQLTGWGIDNYGVKKILPKLIIVAILINLSYFICTLCVDLSNILGGSFNELFSNLPANIPQNVSDAVGNVPGQVGKTILSAGLLSAVAVGGFMVVWSNPAIILSLLVGALGVLIAFLFLFVLLAGRQAAVLVLTVISPLAFVCYMLPSLKKTIFDKWLKLWQGLLLVYPICGLLVGGGNYTSRLLASTGMAGSDFFGALTVMLVGIVPIFFVPTVLKGAFAAMGSLGTKLAGFGSKMRGGATGAMRRSNAYKDAQERGLERRNRIKGGIGKDGKAIDFDNAKMGKFRRFIRGGKRGVSSARSQYLKDQDKRYRDDSLMGVGFAAAAIGQQKKAEADETANYMTLINNETRNGEDEGALFDMYDQYVAAGNKAGAVAVARIAGRRKDTAARFLNEKVTGYGLKTDEAKEGLRQFNAAHSEIFRSVAKEVSTGENSKMYRESTPVGFEFAAQYNRNGENLDYVSWSSDGENIQRAMDNYITNSHELVGTKNSSLEELYAAMNDGRMDVEHVNRLRNLAKETIENRATTGVWDSTKADNLYRIAGMSPAEISIDHSAPSGGSGSGAGRGSAGGSGGSTDSGGPVRIVPGSGSGPK